MAVRPIVNLADAEFRTFGNGENYSSRLARLGPAIGAAKLGCQLHVVDPGKSAFPFHAHHVNEEMYLILDGAGTLRLGEEEILVKKNDLIAAIAGDEKTAHQLSNTGKNELRYLVFSTRHDPEVVEYPDSGKFAVYSMVPEGEGHMNARVAYIGRKKNSLDYFDGENQTD